MNDISHDINSVERYTQKLLNFQHVIEDLVLPGKLSERAKLTELKSYNFKAGQTVRLPWLKT